MNPINSSSDQIHILDLIKAYCEKHHTGKTLSIWLFEDGEFNTSNDDANKLFKELPGYVPVKSLHCFNSELVIHEVSEDLARRMLRFAHDDKWGFGESFFVWFCDHLEWGRD